LHGNSRPKTNHQVGDFQFHCREDERKDVVAVFDAMQNLIERDLKRGPGIVNLAGLMKIKVVKKPAVPARKGINPFTKEEVMFKAKPARNVVKVQPLKTLKDMV
jgi:nucleoid DNA-binding protein